MKNLTCCFKIHRLHYSLLLILTFCITQPVYAAWSVVESLNGGNVSAFSRDASGNIFSVTNGGGIFKSSDGGLNWSSINTGLNSVKISAIAVDSANHLYASSVSSNSEIYKSTDGGASWSTITTINSSVGALFVDNSDAVYAGTAGGSAIFKSTDGGTTWADASSGLSNINAGFTIYYDVEDFAQTSNGDLFCIQAKMVYKSSDAGANWAQVGAADLPLASEISDIQSDNANVYISVENAAFGQPTGIFKSSDGGTSWVAMNSGLIDGAGSAYKAYALSIATADELFASVLDDNAGDHMIFRSTDGGTSWTSSNTPLTKTTVLSASGNQVLAGLEGKGIYRTADSGSNWEFTNNGFTALNISALATRGNGDLLVGSAELDVSISSDNGTTWSTQTIASSGNGNWRVTDLAEDSSGNLYASTTGNMDGGELFKSSDNGSSWSAANNGLLNGVTYMNGNALEISPNGNLYLGTTVGVYKSTDGANSWTHTTRFSDVIAAPSDLLAASDNDVYATYVNLFNSDDSGDTWNQVNTGSFATFDIFEDSNGTLFAFNTALRKSSNSGATWSESITSIPAGSAATAFLDDGAGTLYIGVTGANVPADSGVYSSTDGGDTWSKNNDGLTGLSVTSLTLSSDGNIYAGTQGGGLFRMASTSGGGSGSTDTTAPVITVPANITVAATDATGTANSDASISSFLAAATATDDVGLAGTVSHDAPSIFPAGTTTTVTFSVADAAGNIGTATATVTIEAFDATGTSDSDTSSSDTDSSTSASTLSPYLLFVLLGLFIGRGRKLILR